MKKLGYVLLAVMITTAAYAQKDELKAAEKALKSGDLAAARTAVTQAEGKLEEKNKAKFSKEMDAQKFHGKWHGLIFSGRGDRSLGASFAAPRLRPAPGAGPHHLPLSRTVTLCP